MGLLSLPWHTPLGCTHGLVTGECCYATARTYQAEQLEVAVGAVEAVEVVEVEQQHLARVLSEERSDLLQRGRHRRPAETVHEVEGT